jgi:hypothetical protein
MEAAAKIFLAIPIALCAIALLPALAEDERNCDPRAGLVDGSCYADRPQEAWWKCVEGDTYSTPQERDVTEEQLRRLEDLGLGIFSPELPGYGPEFTNFSSADLTRRFGRPLSSESRERRPYDPGDPMEILTRWEYRGLRIVTVASKPKPDVLRVDRGEVFEANIALRHGVRIGQSIDLWEKQFGRANCSRGHPVYEGQYYFGCGRDKTISCVSTYRIELFLDGSGKVQRMAWDHPML